MKYLQEVSFILPVENRYGTTEVFEQRLAETAGGFTSIPCRGGWVSYLDGLVIDQNTLYTVAVDSSMMSFDILTLARERAVSLGQEALYWKNSDGNVTIFELNKSPRSRDS